MPTLDFKGKQHIYAHHLTVPYRPLVPDPERSLHPAEVDDNLIIHGDNLHALKALLLRYAGKVKCIYIDPPYNTGNEGWLYNDNVNSPLMREWLKGANPVDGEDLERHDKWLCMMWPRLHLLKELLADDGVIFVSIDDNEQHHLRMLMDEIFGEKRFLAEFVWKSRQNRDNRNVTGASIDHEYIICYGDSIRGDDRKTELYSNPDNDPRGDWASGNMVGLATRESRPNLHFDLINPETGINYGCPSRGWRYDQERMASLIVDDRILWPETPDGRPRVKVFLKELRTRFTGFSSIVGDGVFTRSGTREIEEIFTTRVFEFPKSYELIRELIVQGCPDDGIVLDSFAGSGTTAQAVLELNREDGGNRKFILVECEDYADSITAERVRRVSNGVPGARDAALREGLGGSFTYCTLGNPIDVEADADRAKVCRSIRNWRPTCCTRRLVCLPPESCTRRMTTACFTVARTPIITCYTSRILSGCAATPPFCTKRRPVASRAWAKGPWCSPPTSTWANGSFPTWASPSAGYPTKCISRSECKKLAVSRRIER